MQLREQVALAELTTFRVGGLARYVAICASVDDVREACAFAHEQSLPFAVLGSGSNVLAHDDGFNGVVLLIQIPGIVYIDASEDVLVQAGAGVLWDSLVEDVAHKELWGLENLAGIPGTVGATPVQNVGAYGAEIAQLLESAIVLDVASGRESVYSAADCVFGYRDSVFKQNRSLVITSVTFRVHKKVTPRLGYSDLARMVEEGMVLDTPMQIVEAVRSVRSGKFPNLHEHGTAGSFFKNPLLTQEQFKALAAQYGAIPSFPAGPHIKVPLAFILDRILGLRGFARGNVHLFGNQPLVVVTEKGATAKEVDAFANEISRRVQEKTGIGIEREVRMFP